MGNLSKLAKAIRSPTEAQFSFFTKKSTEGMVNEPASLNKNDFFVCRLCEQQVLGNEMESHTSMCAESLDLLQKCENFNRELKNIYSDLEMDRNEKTVSGLKKTMSKAICIKENDKDAAIKLKKYIDKIQGFRDSMVGPNPINRICELLSEKRNCALFFKSSFSGRVDFSNVVSRSQSVSSDLELSKKRDIPLISWILKHTKRKSSAAPLGDKNESNPINDVAISTMMKMPSIDDFQIIKKISGGSYGYLFRFMLEKFILLKKTLLKIYMPLKF